jgi:hypothetical protein
MEADTSTAESANIPTPIPPRVRELPKRSTFAEYAESLLVTVLLALFGTTFIVQAFKIPSQSMEPTLLVGDHLLVNKFIFEGNGAWYEKLLPYRAIRRGDIIVFKFPFDDHPHYVKRVIRCLSHTWFTNRLSKIPSAIIFRRPTATSSKSGFARNGRNKF